MNKFIETSPASGATPATYKLAPATLVDIINPSVPVDSTGSLVRAAMVAGVIALLVK